MTSSTLPEKEGDNNILTKTNPGKKLNHEEIIQLMNLCGVADTILYFLGDPAGEANIEDQVLASYFRTLYVPLAAFLSHLGLVDLDQK